MKRRPFVSVGEFKTIKWFQKNKRHIYKRPFTSLADLSLMVATWLSYCSIISWTLEHLLMLHDSLTDSLDIEVDDIRCENIAEKDVSDEEIGADRRMWKDHVKLKRIKERQKLAVQLAEKQKLKRTYDLARRKKMSRAQDGILKYMLKLMEVCKARGFVYGINPEKGKPVSGASDNIRAWWKEKVKFDKNGPAAIAKYEAECSAAGDLNESRNRNSQSVLEDLQDATLGSLVFFDSALQSPSKEASIGKKGSTTLDKMTAKECAIWLGLLSLEESLIGKPSIDTDTSVIIERPQGGHGQIKNPAISCDSDYDADDGVGSVSSKDNRRNQLMDVEPLKNQNHRNTLSDTDHTDLQPVEYHQMHETKQASFTTIASRPLKRDLSGPVSCPSQQNPELHHKTIHSTFDDPSLDCGTNHDGQHSQVRTDVHRENDRFLIPTNTYLAK
ncbi:hypothetical protein NC653_000315 [Populus alba x Populus x berolinensis]|uniref:Ethylene insensitive 3-like DNA-binding domain-containing protein n=2 Tax=Populus alba x Populus x berolinensis TaxID=444605 RepID=A0AAD6RIC3_9ROSI|nr:hypothetical protein NC653_000315 [Populus alba x Populus x berolinensis]